MRSWRDWSWADGNFWDSGVQPLSSALIDTWFVARGLDDNDWNTAIDALRQFIEETPESKNGKTFQHMVEWFMLSDIRDCIRELK